MPKGNGAALFPQSRKVARVGLRIGGCVYQVDAPTRSLWSDFSIESMPCCLPVVQNRGRKRLCRKFRRDLADHLFGAAIHGRGVNNPAAEFDKERALLQWLAFHGRANIRPATFQAR